MPQFPNSNNTPVLALPFLQLSLIAAMSAVHFFCVHPSLVANTPQLLQTCSPIILIYKMSLMFGLNWALHRVRNLLGFTLDRRQFQKKEEIAEKQPKYLLNSLGSQVEFKAHFFHKLARDSYIFVSLVFCLESLNFIGVSLKQDAFIHILERQLSPESIAYSNAFIFCLYLRILAENLLWDRENVRNRICECILEPFHLGVFVCMAKSLVFP